MDDVMDTIYRGIRWFLDKIVGNIAALGLLAGTLFAILEIVRRYMFGVVFEWGQDFVIYVIIGSVFFYFGVTQAKRAHLVMSAFTDVLRNRGFGKVVLVSRIFVSGFSLFFFSFFVYWGHFAVERTFNDGAHVAEHVPAALAVPIAAAIRVCPHGAGDGFSPVPGHPRTHGQEGVRMGAC